MSAMTPERWQRIKQLLHSALARAPEERAVFLDEACADDPSLRGEVYALIASYEEAGGFIESPAFEVLAESLASHGAESVAGRTLDHYKVLEVIGSGGMGEVYLAEDTRLGRPVALKMLHASFTTDRERVRRFQQEARAASALNHPNILTIYEIGQVDSSHFISTEFIEGETLRQHLLKRPMKLNEALDIGVQVASALTTAHQAGIVHRDIKPENIMLRRDALIKVLDFGLAKLTEQTVVTSESPTMVETAQGMVMGTPHYMSPEQARGLRVDARADIWSLGVVLYEMVCGRVPFEGATSSDVIAAILGSEPVPPARYAPDIPVELEWMLKKALRKDREERYQTARELLTDLKALKRRLEFEEELERSTAAGKPQGASIVRSSAPPVASRAPSQTQEGQSREIIDSLAVLPLMNASHDPEMEYFSDGITESIINALSQLPGLRVVARSSVFRYKGREVDPQEVRQQLGVRAMLTGRVQQVGDHLMIAAELIDVENDSQLWGERYNRKLSDIFEVQEEIAHEISEKLRLRLTREQKKNLGKRYTENTEAYHLYLKGRFFWNKRTEEATHKSIEYFRRAIELDPNYALAYAGLADAYTKLGDVGVPAIPPREAFAKGKAAAVRALEIDAALAEVHASLAHLNMHDYQWADAEREFKCALELNPGYPTAHHWYAYFLMFNGRVDESLAEMKRTLELDRLSPLFTESLGEMLYYARRYEEAIDTLKEALALDGQFFPAYVTLARTYAEKRWFEQAIAAFQTARTLCGDSPSILASLGHVYASAGLTEEASRLLARLEELSKSRYVSPYDLAVVYAGLNETERALESLSKADAERSEGIIYLTIDPRLDSLRREPRYAELVRRVGLCASALESTATLILPQSPEGRVSPEIAATASKARTERALQNLSLPPTPLIGREAEVAAALDLLHRAEVRLLTLTGPGGTGKTRLSLEIGAKLSDEFSDGLFFIGLASISDPELVPAAIAQALGVKEAGGRPLSESLKKHLLDKEALLILDNFEQVLPAALQVAELLAASRGLKVMVTSRAALRVRGEQEFPVPPLELPDLKRLPPVDGLAHNEAVRLFVERARAVKPDFALTNENAGAVAEVCARLDGLPLAIELAAARIKVLSPTAMLERLESRLKLLTGGAQDLPARQQTMRKAIEWSYGLLDESEKALFRGMSVFVGGCTLSAVEAVSSLRTQPVSDTLDTLASLVDKSLLKQKEVMGEPRFMMLETIREYGLESLTEAGEALALRRQHAEYYMGLAERAEPKLWGGEQVEWMDRLELEQDNLRAALEWSQAENNVEVELRLTGALWRFWTIRNLSEGRERVERAVARSAAAPVQARAKLLLGAGWLNYFLGDYERARSFAEESFALAQQAGDKRIMSLSLNPLGRIAFDAEDYVRAAALFENALVLARESEDRFAIGFSLNNLGELARVQGRYDEARPLYEEALANSREIGNQTSESTILGNLGHMALSQGDKRAAASYYEQSLKLNAIVGSKRATMYGLVGMAGAYWAERDPARAACLLGAAEALREAINYPIEKSDLPPYERSVAAVRARLTEEAFTEAWAHGRSIAPDEAITLALEENANS